MGGDWGARLGFPPCPAPPLGVEDILCWTQVGRQVGCSAGCKWPPFSPLTGEPHEHATHQSATYMLKCQVQKGTL
jgi:hypothetical protein